MTEFALTYVSTIGRTSQTVLYIYGLNEKPGHVVLTTQHNFFNQIKLYHHQMLNNGFTFPHKS